PAVLIYLHYSRHHQDLPSFPTRRSSDLGGAGARRRLSRLRGSGRAARAHRRGGRAALARPGSLQGAAELGPARPRTGQCPLSRRSEEHTSELQSLAYIVCRLLLEKKKKK